MKNFLKNLGLVAVFGLLIAAFVLSLRAYNSAHQNVQQQSIVPPGEHGNIAPSIPVESGPTAGATIPTAVSRYETSLAAKISSSDTSMTLSNDPLYTAIGTYLTGNACFTIDEGTSVVEDVCGTASGTAITGLIRGISPLTGTSSVSSLKFEHRKGANVKITNSPQLIVLSRILNGNETLPNPLIYDSSISTTSLIGNLQALASVAYVDNGLLQGAPTATTTVPGVVQIATTLQVANSTGMTGVYTLVPAASLFSQAWRSATTVPVTNATGTLASDFIDQTANYIWSGSNTLSGTTTITGTVVGFSQFSPFGTGSDGNATISATSTLSSDKYIII